MTAVVVSDKMDKTVVVKVERKFVHPKFKKIVRTAKKYKVHDEKNECRAGDVVAIVETRPLSKEKRWRLQEIIKKSEGAEKVEEEAANEP
ncbi:MAG: 30S ribosomal protein S17 [Nitrospinae bacterium]|nr:30S ribosomal protein S17 [Nitrospinota bacterium]